MTEDETAEIVDRVVQRLDEREAKRSEEMAERLWNSDEANEEIERRATLRVEIDRRFLRPTTARMWPWIMGWLFIVAALLILAIWAGTELSSWIE